MSLYLKENSNESLRVLGIRQIMPWWCQLLPALDEMSPELGAGEAIDGEGKRGVECHKKAGNAGQNFVPD